MNSNLSGAAELQDWSPELSFQRDVTEVAASVLGRLSSPRQVHAQPLRLDKVGFIGNGRSHRNRGNAPRALPHDLSSDVLVRTPGSIEALSEALLQFSQAGVGLLVIDGGDGTIRDVISCAAAAFPQGLPAIAVLPSGKTNALAGDLGIPADWSFENALAAARRRQYAYREPMEISRAGDRAPVLRGFLFGAGAFVRATALAQRTHKMGAFNNLAVGMSFAWAVSQTVFGKAGNPWRAGDDMRLTADGRRFDQDKFYVLFASALRRLPMGMKPFGKRSEGLKLLAVDAPPRRVWRTLPGLLAGSEHPRIEENGFYRMAPREFTVTMKDGFILDGELYHGGTLTVRRGKSVRFVTP